MASSYSTQNQHSETHSSSRGGSNTTGGSTSRTAAVGEVNPLTGLGYWVTQQGYQQSQQVSDAYNRLQNALNNAPGAFKSNYTQSLNNLYNQIMNRKGFQYNMNNDAMYQAYKDQYTQQGKQAMKDTIAQGAALTGGYQNSYANTAGSQAYQAYLQRLNEIVPQLQQNAYQMYKDETSDLYNKANLTKGLYDTDYQHYRDKKSDYYTDRDYFTNFYNNERNFDYGKFRDDRNYYASEYWNQRNAVKQTDTSNWSHTDTWNDTDSYTDSQSSTSSYTSGGGSSSGSSSSKKKDNAVNGNQPERKHTLNTSDNTHIKNTLRKSNSDDEFNEKLARLAQNGDITEGDYIYILQNKDSYWNGGHGTGSF